MTMTATTSSTAVVAASPLLPSGRRRNCLEQTWSYLDAALSQLPGLKVLLCDDATRNVLSVAYSQHQLLQHNVVLVDMLSNGKARYVMKHFACVVVCRPSADAMSALYQELAEGNFAAYAIYFTYLLDAAWLQSLANADVYHLVSCVGELYLDAVPVTEWACVAPLRPSPLGATPTPALNPMTLAQWASAALLTSPSATTANSNNNNTNASSSSSHDAAPANTAALARMAECVISTLLASNRRPVIRYRGGSLAAEALAREVAARMRVVHATFPDLKARDAVLLVLDRVDDPVTPLLMPWTYEALIGELLGMQRGNEVVVDDDKAAMNDAASATATNVAGEDDNNNNNNAAATAAAVQTPTRPEERVHVLAPHTDSFFAQHRYDDWGQVCLAIGELVKAYKELNHFDRNTVSLDEIRHFMTRFPEARKQSAQVTRHCGIASQLAAEINGRNLTRLSTLEQDMVSSNNVAEHSRLLLELVQDPETDVDDALRLVALYALRYEKTVGHTLPQLRQELAQRQCPAARIALIDRLLAYAGQERRAHELFRASTGHFLKTVVKSVGPFGKDVQNVLTQHTPLLKKLVNRAYNGTLSAERYPACDVTGAPIATAQAPYVRGKDIFVVYLGGVTYTERMLLWQLNEHKLDNNTESLLNLGKQVSRRLGGGGAAAGGGDGNGADAAVAAATDDGSAPTTKIEARVVLLSTATINSKDFLRSLPASSA